MIKVYQPGDLMWGVDGSLPRHIYPECPVLEHQVIGIGKEALQLSYNPGFNTQCSWCIERKEEDSPQS